MKKVRNYSYTYNKVIYGKQIRYYLHNYITTQLINIFNSYKEMMDWIES